MDCILRRIDVMDCTVLWGLLVLLSCRLDVVGAAAQSGGPGDCQFGEHCAYACHCKYNIACDATTGHCALGCTSGIVSATENRPGWSGDGCQIGNYLIDQNATNGPDTITAANLATDGVVDNNGNCARSSSVSDSEQLGWWQGDMGGMYGVSKVIVYPTIITNYISYTLIEVSANPDGSDAQICGDTGFVQYNSQPTPVSCIRPIAGRYIRLTRMDTAPLNNMLQVCEVQVQAFLALACEPLFYGAGCLSECDCDSGSCDSVTGECLDSPPDPGTTMKPTTVRSTVDSTAAPSTAAPTTREQGFQGSTTGAGSGTGGGDPGPVSGDSGDQLHYGIYIGIGVGVLIAVVLIVAWRGRIYRKKTNVPPPQPDNHTYAGLDPKSLDPVMRENPARDRYVVSQAMNSMGEPFYETIGQEIGMRIAQTVQEKLYSNNPPPDYDDCSGYQASGTSAAAYTLNPIYENNQGRQNVDGLGPRTDANGPDYANHSFLAE